MKEMTHRTRLAFAFGISTALNLGLLLSAALYDPRKPPSVLSRAADVLTTPPGIIVGWLFTPTHTGRVMVEAVFCSLVFYAIVVWAILELVAHLSHRGHKNEGSSLRLNE
jgi:hypothetical protein